MNKTKGVSDAERFDDNNFVRDREIAFEKKEVERARRAVDPVPSCKGSQCTVEEPTESSGEDATTTEKPASHADDVALARNTKKRHDVIPLEFYAYNLPEPLRRDGNDSRSLAESILIVNRSKDSNVNVFRLMRFDLSDALAREAAAMCENLPLKGRAQMDVCRHYPTAMPAIVRGVQLAINQTKIDLQKRKWDGSSLTNPKFGQNLLKKGETFFDYESRFLRIFWTF